MNVEQYCREKFNITLKTALTTPYILYRLVDDLKYKGYNYKVIAELLSVKEEKIISNGFRFSRLKPPAKPLSADQQQRINKFLKIEHYRG